MFKVFHKLGGAGDFFCLFESCLAELAIDAACIGNEFFEFLKAFFCGF